MLYARDARGIIKGAGTGDRRAVVGLGHTEGEPAGTLDLPERKRDPAKVKPLPQEAGVGADFESTIVAEIGEQVENEILQQQRVTAGSTRKSTTSSTVLCQPTPKGQLMMSISGSRVVTDPSDTYPFASGAKDQERERPDHEPPGYCNGEVPTA